jgi:hypothetical protein
MHAQVSVHKSWDLQTPPQKNDVGSEHETCPCKCYHHMGVGVWECTCISCSEIVVVTWFRNGNPWSGTAFVCGSVSCPWQKCAKCQAGLQKHWVIVLYYISELQGGYRHSKWKNVNCWCASHQMFRTCYTDMSVTINELLEWRWALHCAISWAWRDFCVYSTPNFITGLKSIQDCCLVGAVSFKWGLTVATLWDVLY